jgi:hypothetical protein
MSERQGTVEGWLEGELFGLTVLRKTASMEVPWKARTLNDTIYNRIGQLHAILDALIVMGFIDDDEHNFLVGRVRLVMGHAIETWPVKV